MNYKIVSGSKESVESEVMDLLSHGWKKVGGVSVTFVHRFQTYSDNPHEYTEVFNYAQAMELQWSF